MAKYKTVYIDTKKHNALNRLNSRFNNKVVEYELVPTGDVYING